MPASTTKGKEKEKIDEYEVGRTYLAQEMIIRGQPFSSASGQGSPALLDTLAAFQHYVFLESHEEIVLRDFEGVLFTDNAGQSRLILFGFKTDASPEHLNDRGASYLESGGNAALLLFVNSHECNSFCREMMLGSIRPPPTPDLHV
ncbi:hypothetical protein NLJ89_g4846 [Agrocybe chaxingu]|uniref:Alpha-type protein kinase domain-containing protein n=1 Tax=Agrocybe chaxingu TaxID=84603 RepID=A0A9W8MXE0_9AGAR|nr:hypothetical protein NLJ89_g4846 [Agrocybe chaxingu]